MDHGDANLVEGGFKCDTPADAGKPFVAAFGHDVTRARVPAAASVSSRCLDVLDPDWAVFHGSPAAKPRTLVAILDATCAAHPEAPALADETCVLTYAALSREVKALASRLHAVGIGAGDRVGIRVPSGTADLYVAILAVLESGAAYVPVDADDPEDRAETVWSEAGVCAVFGACRELSLRPEVRPLGRCHWPTPDDDAWIIFTSGSTGRPKGVAITHRSAAAFVDAEAALFRGGRALEPNDRMLAGLSAAFDASCEEMWLAWRHGACLAPAPRALVRAGADLGPWLVERGITVVSTVPTLAVLWPATALERVRLLILGGEACPAELAARLRGPGREVWNTYGPTEATVVSCAALLDGEEVVRIGLPLAGWSLAVVDGTGTPVGLGQVGELVIGGVGLGRYLDRVRDQERYAPLPALGWHRAYRSGDLVRADPAGLVFVGRKDEQVKLAGRRVELGEVDTELQALPGVAAAAAAVRRTPAGSQVLVGYVVPTPGSHFDPVAARSLLTRRLPAQLVPALAVVDRLPVRTSGKVDRDALPWPLPSDAARSSVAEDLDDELRWLAQQWTDQLGPVPLSADADFFALGGSSLTAAQLVSALRTRYPSASVADVYQYPTLAGLARRLEDLGTAGVEGRPVRPTPPRAFLLQFPVLLALSTLTGVRWITAMALFIKLIGDPPWAPRVSWVALVGAWLVLFSLPSRFIIAVTGNRLLLRGVRPGSFPRGGSVHLRLWAAERLVSACHVAMFSGTPWAGWYARVMGCEVGREVSLHTLPPVTGLASFGAGCALESEVDVAGWWLDGDVLHVGEIRVGAGARVGTRATLLPGADVGAYAEIEPGTCVTGAVPAGEKWAGSPARHVGNAGDGWPAPRSGWPRRWTLAYGLSLIGLSLLPLIISVPALVVMVLLVRDASSLYAALGRAMVGAPLAVVLVIVTYTGVVALIVRWAGRGLQEGFHPLSGGAAWCAWLIDGCVTGALGALFPVYASLLTPLWLRMLGARVGRRVEASTVTLLPQLTSVEDRAFLADHSLVAPKRLRAGWLHLAAAHVGNTSFVGNSAMVGPGRSVPDHSLVGVLSAAPAQARPHSSWLGQPAREIPRVAEQRDPARTFHPPRRLVAARAAVEACRLVPILLSVLLAQHVIATLAEVFFRAGLVACVAVSGLVLLAGGVVACALTAAAKWLLMGRISPAEHPLWSPFVWRNELVDCFTEILAVPWLARSCLGTPLLNVWLRSMGACVGRGVWCETWWLPEFELITLEDGVSVNRGTVLQTHLFHDRIMRLDRVHLGAGATLGPHSIILPGTRLGTQTSVCAASLVMRGETVPGNTRWLGNPIAAWPVPPGSSHDVRRPLRGHDHNKPPHPRSNRRMGGRRRDVRRASGVSTGSGIPPSSVGPPRDASPRRERVKGRRAAGPLVLGIMIGLVAGSTAMWTQGALTSSALPVSAVESRPSPAVTAAELSRATFPAGGTGNVVLTADAPGPDALAAGALQGLLQAPLLVTDFDALSSDAGWEITRLGRPNVHIIGGAERVSPAIEEHLRAAGHHVHRHAGSTRVQTSISIADLHFPLADMAVLAPAAGDPRATLAESVAAGTLAAQRQVPLLFTGAQGLSPETEAYLGRSAVERVVIVGDQSAIGPAVVKRLRDLGLATSRIAGADSYGTAVAIAQQIRFHSTAQDDAVVLADGSEVGAWPGAYAAPLHSIRRNAPVLFTNGAELPLPTREYLEANGHDGLTQLVCMPGVTREACAAARRLVGAG